VAEGLARRATREPDRFFAHLLAARLTPEDPEDCPPAAELPAGLRAELRALAARLDQPPAE